MLSTVCVVILWAIATITAKAGDSVYLSGPPGRTYGRVEVLKDGQRGTVCDDSWDNQDATVVCRQLNLPSHDAVAVSGALFGQGHGHILLYYVLCSETEQDLTSCSSGPGPPNCNHNEDAGVICQDSQVPLYLGGRNGSNFGRVEVFKDGKGGTICDSHFNVESARVICRQLGLSTSNPVAVSLSSFGQGNSQIWLSNLHCKGNESSLDSCKFNDDRRTHTCNHSHDIGVICGESLVMRVNDSCRINSAVNCEVQVYYNKEWMYLKYGSHLAESETKVLCRQLGMETGTPSVRKSITDDTVGQLVTFIKCTGNETNIGHCQFAIENVNGDEKEIVSLVCGKRPTTRTKAPSTLLPETAEYQNTYATVNYTHTIESDLIPTHHSTRDVSTKHPTYSSSHTSHVTVASSIVSIYSRFRHSTTGRTTGNNATQSASTPTNNHTDALSYLSKSTDISSRKMLTSSSQTFNVTDTSSSIDSTFHQSTPVPTTRNVSTELDLIATHHRPDALSLHSQSTNIGSTKMPIFGTPFVSKHRAKSTQESSQMPDVLLKTTSRSKVSTRERNEVSTSTNTVPTTFKHSTIDGRSPLMHTPFGWTTNSVQYQHSTNRRWSSFKRTLFYLTTSSTHAVIPGATQNPNSEDVKLDKLDAKTLILYTSAPFCLIIIALCVLYCVICKRRTSQLDKTEKSENETSDESGSSSKTKRYHRATATSTVGSTTEDDYAIISNCIRATGNHYSQLPETYEAPKPVKDDMYLTMEESPYVYSTISNDMENTYFHVL